MKTDVSFMLALSIFLISILCSCSPKIYPQAGTDVTDSVRIEVRTEYRDTTIFVFVPDESVENTTSDTISRLHTSVAESVAEVRNGMLYHSLRNRDTARLQHHFRAPTKMVTKEHKQLITNRVVVEVEKELSWWQKTTIYLGYVMMGLIAILVVLGVIKLKTKPF